jgi:hypothetical protein
MSGVSTVPSAASPDRRPRRRWPTGVPQLWSLGPGLAAVALFVDWAIQDGGYDPSTWYWGGLLAAGLLAALLLAPAGARARVGRSGLVALAAFGMYVAWSYLSIAWAASPGDALQGSNRALLYLLLFAALAVVRWTPRTALVTLTAFALAIGALAVVFLTRLATHDGLASIIVSGRLEAPAGYFNASAALFTIGALLAVALASRRTLSPPLRGLLLGMAAAGLELAVAAASRGWLFTLPLVLLAAVALVRDRIRFVLAAVLPAVATAAVAHRFLGIYDARASPGFAHVTSRAGQSGLVACGIVVLAGTLLAVADALLRPPASLVRGRRLLGAAMAVVVLAAGAAGGLAATHGHPFSFVKRQWNGFSHPQQASQAGSRFDVVGSGRYDFWRVALDAFEAHPLQGLGQDNFADFYIRRRRTSEEPAWTHSLEMRLLAMNGAVGTVLFVIFLAAALVAALRRRRTDGEGGSWLAGAALLPLSVWLIHGSVDWFWEMPCLAGPALGFLGMAGSLRRSATPAPEDDRRPTRWRTPLRLTAGLGGLAVATAVLGLPYLSVAEQARAERERSRNPVAALSDLATAAELDPLTAAPARLAGAIALQSGQYEIALERFHQAIEREPGGWFGWFGEGLAASSLGQVASARHDFEMARAINRVQPAVGAALARVSTTHPLTATQGLQMLVIVQ